MLRTLRCTVNQRTRLASSNRTLKRAVNPQILHTSSNGRPAAESMTKRKIILLFRKIVGYVNTLEPEILGYIKMHLDDTLPNVRSPQVVYERVITFLASRKYAQEAVLLYERMHEAGLMSSNTLDAKMLAMALAIPHESPQPLIRRLASIFTTSHYTDKDFLGLLKTMKKYGVNKNIVSKLVEIFISNRGPNYIIRPDFLATLLLVQIYSGGVNVALDVLDQYSSVNNLNRPARDSLRAPYVQVLAALQETRTWDSASVDRILGLMMTQELTPDLTTFNILLSREMRLGNYHSAMTIYSMLKKMRIAKKIPPDCHTFASMFLLYRMKRPRAVRKQHRRNLASPFPPRALYYDFMLAAKPKGNADRIVPSCTLMNVILRAFIRQRDYAGAFVVLNSFSLFNIPLDHRTYYHIMKHVVRRIWIEVCKQFKGKVAWSLMFLGVPDYRHVELNEELVLTMFAFVSGGTFRLTSPLYASRHHMPPACKFKLPSMEMMQSVALPDPQDFYYEPVPLKRILRRAILATLRLADDNAGPADVSKAIADAKVDMLPKIFQHKHSTASTDVQKDRSREGSSLKRRTLGLARMTG